MSILYRAFFSDRGEFGVAYADCDAGRFFLPDHGLITEWAPLTLELREGHFADYPANNLGCRLCSPRLKGLLDSMASSDDVLQWLPVQVYRGNDDRPYFVLHFPYPPDVIHKEFSILVDTFVVKPVFDQGAITGHHVFSWIAAGEAQLVVTKSVKTAIEALQCTGITFSRAPTA